MRSFYNRADLTPIAAELGRADLSPADHALALKIWNGGAKNWNNAPLADAAHAGGDPDCRVLVINYVGAKIQDLIDFLRRQSVLPGGIYLDALAGDMSCYADPFCSGAQEPWPQV